MIRTSICIDKDRRTKLFAESERTGAPLAELVRRAIDLYLEAHRDDSITEYHIIRKHKEDKT
jgi:predicted DNA-binding protein